MALLLTDLDAFPQAQVKITKLKQNKQGVCVTLKLLCSIMNLNTQYPCLPRQGQTIKSLVMLEGERHLLKGEIEGIVVMNVVVEVLL
jgi:hypothetical protein